VDAHVLRLGGMGGIEAEFGSAAAGSRDIELDEFEDARFAPEVLEHQIVEVSRRRQAERQRRSGAGMIMNDRMPAFRVGCAHTNLVADPHRVLTGGFMSIHANFASGRARERFVVRRIGFITIVHAPAERALGYWLRDVCGWRR
jgi:hypothetical protein